MGALAGVGPCAHGPAPRRRAARRCTAIWVDAGTRDEYFLDLGAQAFVDALAEIGVTDVHHETYDAGHGAIDYRYPLSLAYLAEKLAV